jgi:hypothetical protein
MVLFAVERRKAWRMLQSKAGVVNKDSRFRTQTRDRSSHQRYAPAGLVSYFPPAWPWLSGA